MSRVIVITWMVRWRRQDLRQRIAARFGVELHERTVGKYLAAFGYRCSRDAHSIVSIATRISSAGRAAAGTPLSEAFARLMNMAIWDGSFATISRIRQGGPAGH